MISIGKLQATSGKLQADQIQACSLWLAACSLIFLISSCAPDIEKIKEISLTNDAITEKGEDVEIHYSEEGKLKATVVAKEVITYSTDDPYMEFSKGVKLNFFNDALDTTSRLTANYGLYYTNKKEMMVRDKVEIINIKGEKLDTEELTWKRKDEKIYSDKFVRITTPEEIIYGTGFEAKQDFSDYTIKNISGTVQVKDALNNR